MNSGKEQFSIISKDILVTHEYPPFFGGVATYCVEVSTSAATRGRNLAVWAPGSPDPKDAPGVIRLGGTVSLQWRALWQFSRAIYARKADWQGQRVLLASLGAHWVFAHLWRFGLLGNARLIPIFHGSEILRYERHPWFRSFIKDWLNSCERIVAASVYTQQRVQQSELCPKGKIVELAPCGVRQDLLAAASNLSPDEIQRSESKTWKILTLARLHPRKGQLDVIRALGQLPETLRKQTLYQLAGTGEKDYQLELQSVARERGVELELLGAVDNDQLAAVYSDCDLYVMTSRSLAQSVEGFGMTYLEAGLFGKPVIGYRTGGVTGAVKHEETGLLVEEGNIEALSVAISTLLNDSSRRQTMGRQGRALALASTWESTVQALLD